MSAQEFKVGQTVSGDDFAYLPRGTVVAGPGVPTRRKDALGMWVTRDSGHPAAVPDKGMAMSRTITYLPDSAEPEDKDDLYVEPEPLKEGDWVQVWAQVNRLADDDGDLLLVSRAYGEAAMTSRKFYTRSDAIVRPDAGQAPPWVSVATANVAAIARVLMDEGGMEHAAAFAHAESLDRAGIRAEGGVS